MKTRRIGMTHREILVVLAITVVAMILILGIVRIPSRSVGPRRGAPEPESLKPSSSVRSTGGPDVASRPDRSPRGFRARAEMDTGGFTLVIDSIQPWATIASLESIAEIWSHPGLKAIEKLDPYLLTARSSGDATNTIQFLITKSLLFNSEGNPRRGYEVLEEARSIIDADDQRVRDWFATITYLQGVSACAAERTTIASSAAGRARASCRSRPPPSMPTRPVPAWRSGTSRSTSGSSPTTWKSSGCSISPT